MVKCYIPEQYTASIFKVTEFVQVHDVAIKKKICVSYVELFRAAQPTVAQIPGTRSLWRLNTVPWHLIPVSRKHGTCLTSPISCLEF